MQDYRYTKKYGKMPIFLISFIGILYFVLHPSIQVDALLLGFVLGTLCLFLVVLVSFDQTLGKILEE